MKKCIFKLFLSAFILLGCVLWSNSILASEDITAIKTANVYKPTTGIISPAPAIGYVHSLKDLKNQTKDVRPAALILEFDDSFSILDENGNPSDVSVNECLVQMNGLVIPVFMPKDEKAYSRLTNFLMAVSGDDYYVVQNDYKKAYSFKTSHPKARILYDARGLSKELLTKEQLKELVKNTSKASSSVVLLSDSQVDRENVEYLQKRYITTWVESGPSNGEIYTTILTGAYGIVANYEDVYKIYDKFEDGSMVRKPLIIGHRGNPTKEYENTIEGAKYAFSHGADYVELDLLYSSDHVPIVYHDFSVSYDSTTLEVKSGSSANLVTKKLSEMTYEEIESLRLLKDGIEYKIPTLENYLLSFENDSNAMFVLEIKTYDTFATTTVKDILSRVQIQDRLVICSFLSTGQISNFYKDETLREIPRGTFLLSQDFSATTTNLLVEKEITNLSPTVSQACPSYAGNISSSNSFALIARGILVAGWTVETTTDGKTIFNNLLTKTTGGITTNDCSLTENCPMYFEYSRKNGFVDLNKEDGLSMEISSYPTNNPNEKKALDLVVLDDGGTGIDLYEGVFICQPSNGTAYIAAKSNLSFYTGKQTTLYSEAVKVLLTDQFMVQDVSIDVKKNSINVSYNSVLNAEEYQIEVMKDKKVIYTERTSELSITISDLEPGSYTILVYAISGDKTSTPCAKAFSITKTQNKSGCSNNTFVLPWEVLGVLSIFSFSFLGIRKGKKD